MNNNNTEFFSKSHHNFIQKLNNIIQNQNMFIPNIKFHQNQHNPSMCSSRISNSTKIHVFNTQEIHHILINILSNVLNSNIFYLGGGGTTLCRCVVWRQTLGLVLRRQLAGWGCGSGAVSAPLSSPSSLSSHPASHSPLLLLLPLLLRRRQARGVVAGR